jgi:hypothetical protein
MIIKLARTSIASAFSGFLAYVLFLNVLLAGFALAAMVDHAVNGTTVICSATTPGGDRAVAPDTALMRHCQICGLTAHDKVALPLMVTAMLARLGVVSAKLFPLEIISPNFTTAYFAEARGPPFSWIK